jgi:hypothetical protein
MAINWGGAAQNNNALAYFAMGQQIGQDIINSRVGKATANVLTSGMQIPGAPGQPAPGQPAPSAGGGALPLPPMAPGGMTPGIGDQHNRDMGRDWATIARYNPQLFAQLQKQQQEQAALEQQKRRTMLVETAKLFDGVTPENYGQRLALAQRMGIDISGAPQAYDPAWVQENQQIMRFAAEKPDQLPMIAQELVQAGYRPNTPEFKQAMASVINSKYAADYVDEQGNTRRRSVLNLSAPQGAPQPPQTVPAQEPITFDMYMSAKQGLGPQGSLEWITQNNIPVRVATPQQASQLPRGTRLILPDGSEGVVP